MVKPQRNMRSLAWLLLLSFFFGYVIYMVSYVGNDWYVVPVEPFPYPPDNQSTPIRMGLFWMCVQSHCLYDLKVDYIIVRYLPYKEIQYASQNYRAVCMSIISVGMVLLCLALGAYFLFLSGFNFSHLMGFVTGGLQLVSSIVTMIGVIIYGVKFRGPTINNPFGWSLWLMVAAILWLAANGILVILLTIVICARKRRKEGEDFNTPLQASF
ncbi:hypothetical protein HELRODRAFT_193624 [Helobdella robusta]|uniref:Uncharacterized protein n=1 Tax=Helobdella robusta TaxID=6412 RepID=T1FV71_HELRO|nr:hypothetical protein HELRODRAFT_193624 [Helobdella robusta]ESN95304.1 hypothetical protein HELRODRAFT_193624 [Helobdella robusta]